MRRRHGDDDVDERDDDETAVHDVPAAGQVGAPPAHKPLRTHLHTHTQAAFSAVRTAEMDLGPNFLTEPDPTHYL